MKTFTVNGKTYKAKEFDFNLVCDLEDEGISIEMMDKKPMSMIRAYFRLCSGRTKQDAGEQIENHIIAGGSMNDVADAMGDAMENSGFFRALREKAQEDAPEDETKTGEKEAASDSENW